MKIKNIQHSTKQWYHNAFSVTKLEKKINGELVKPRNIMNEILWIYSIVFYTEALPEFHGNNNMSYSQTSVIRAPWD